MPLSPWEDSWRSQMRLSLVITTTWMAKGLMSWAPTITFLAIKACSVEAHSVPQCFPNFVKSTQKLKWQLLKIVTQIQILTTRALERLHLRHSPFWWLAKRRLTWWLSQLPRKAGSQAESQHWNQIVQNKESYSTEKTLYWEKKRHNDARWFRKMNDK